MKLFILKEKSVVALKNMLYNMTDNDIDYQLICIFKDFYLNNKKISDLSYKKRVNLTLFVEHCIRTGNIFRLNDLVFNEKINNKQKDIINRNKEKGYIYEQGEPSYFNMISYLDYNNLLCGVHLIEKYPNEMKSQITHFISKGYFVPCDMPDKKTSFYLFYFLFLLSKQHQSKIDLAIDLFTKEDKLSLKNIQNIEIDLKKLLYTDIFYMAKNKESHVVLNKLIDNCGLKDSIINETQYISTFKFFRSLYIHQEYSEDFDIINERMENYFGFVAEQFGDIFAHTEKILARNIQILLFYGKNPFMNQALLALKNHFSVSYSDLFNITIEQIINDYSIKNENKKTVLYSLMDYFSKNAFSENLLSFIQEKENSAVENNKDKESQEFLIELKNDIIQSNKKMLIENINIAVIDTGSVNKVKKRL